MWHIKATNKTKFNKKKVTLGYPVNEGKCVFPFKYKNKYIREEDGHDKVVLVCDGC